MFIVSSTGDGKMKWAPLFILSLLLVPARGFAQTTWYVPDDYPKIQDAISSPAVQNGDTVIVRPGTYEECISFLGKAITLRSEKGPTLTDIDSKDSMLNVVSFENGELEDSVLDGFMIVNGIGKLLNPNDWRGGGVYNYKASPTIRNCIFRYNIANYGGAIYNENSSPTVTNCFFYANGASYDGAAIYNKSSSPLVANCIFDSNTGNDCGGGMYNHHHSLSVVINCIFYDNIAGDGGGAVFNHSTSPTFTNCTFYYNLAFDYGSGMFNHNSSPIITNCIFWYNWPNDEIYNLGTSNPVVTYSDIMNGYIGTGNIQSNPGFVDEVGRDLRITFSSPCHNSGDNNAPHLPDTDVDGEPRVSYDKVDMGADEFNKHLYWIGDSNWTGMARPGGSIKVKLVGHPGSMPVGLFVGSDVLKTPLTTKWGPFYLGSPVTLIGPLGAIPFNGVYVLPGTIPPSPLAPYDLPMQALIGNSFSNLSVLEVREEWPEF